MSGRRATGQKHIRLLDDGLLDEAGLRWDRVAGQENYFMTPAEAAPFVSTASRCLRTSGFGSRAQDVARVEFMRLIQEFDDALLDAFRAPDSGHVIVRIDTSGCFR